METYVDVNVDVDVDVDVYVDDDDVNVDVNFNGRLTIPLTGALVLSSRSSAWAGTFK